MGKSPIFFFLTQYGGLERSKGGLGVFFKKGKKTYLPRFSVIFEGGS